LEDEKVHEYLVRKANDVFGSRSGIYLVSVVDGARKAYDWSRTHGSEQPDEKFDIHWSTCARLIGNAAGKLLFERPAPHVASSNGNGHASLLPCDAAIGRFEEDDAFQAIYVALRIRNRCVEHNLTTDCGLPWNRQLHPRIAIATQLPMALELLQFVWRDDILCGREVWEDRVVSIDETRGDILRASGVRPGPSAKEIETATKLLGKLIASKVCAKEEEPAPV
jgi:hypothetical protein